MPLAAGLFSYPTSEYRGTPFWAWNARLSKEELLWQIDVLHKMGYGGFHMHVRTGMATEYLSDEFMDLARACVEKARKEQMLAWLYDEDRWPSGAAGGFITQNRENRVKHLLLTRTPYGRSAGIERLVQSKATSARTENGRLLACYDVVLDEAGRLEHYKRVDEDSAVVGFKLYAYLETAEDNPWFNNQAYADTLSPETVREFIHATYDRYAEYFEKDFGGVVPAIFTDEPQFSHKTTLDYALEPKDVTLPWTTDLAGTFAAAYPGEGLMAGLPELLWEKKDGVSRVRYLYHDHVAERFAEAFADQCGEWCRSHGLMLAGHMMEEPTLFTQTQALGDAMRSYRSFQLPGIDMLCNRHEYTTAKQAQSACRQFGAPGVMSELYGVTNWDYDFRGHKLQGDWQAALGVTVRVPHLSWVSMNGEAKRDYPGTFGYQAPWHTEYPLVEDHFARVNTALTRGRPVVRVGVIHPVESYWLHFGPKENTRAIRESLDERFQDLTAWLLFGLIDFDFISESLLPGQCEAAGIGRDGFPVGRMKYDVVVVPGCETLRGTTLERLEIFHDAGGRLIFMGEAPKYQDAVESDRGRMLFGRSERVSFERNALLAALEGVREVDVRDSTGGRAAGLLCQLRKEEDGSRWLFVAHGTDPANKDLVTGDTLRIRLRGEWATTLYDTMAGSITPLRCRAENGWTTVEYPFYDHDSLLLKLTRDPTGTPESPPKLLKVSSIGAPGETMIFDAETPPKRFPGPVPVSLEEPNVLLLDMAEYRLGDGDYRPMEEILRLDNLLRNELGLPLRMEAVAQPWTERDESTPHTVGLRYRFGAEVSVKGTKLALERADLASVRLNGKDVPVAADGWFVDKAISTIPLPALPKGVNVLEVCYKYGRKVDLESLYLLGNFGVRVAGCACTLTAPVEKLAFGDITTQGLPFYGGNLTYHLEVETDGAALDIAASCYRGQLLGVAVDGEDKGRIVYSPYRLRVEGLSPGRHKVDIKFFGNRINTFGQLHCNNREPGYWWGPNAWRTVGEEWTYEYRFWRQGILKSPELRFERGGS